ncbi:hypothetical protein [Rheinheimera sp.]|uniref:hypothetical protein n=2 Tax=Rheinheimera sp. TaxID=1869214 RepID=UPI0040481672
MKMKALYNALKAIAESDKERFTHFQDDLYVNDKDAIAHDLQDGDVWYWGLKQCGTYFTLADKNSEYLNELLRPTCSPERRHFLIRISDQFESGFDIKEYDRDGVIAAINKISINLNRKPARRFFSEVLFGLEPMLKGSRLLSDFTANKGATLYLSLTANSVTYISNNGASRTLGLPFNFERTTGAYKVKITSQFGHAEIEQIKQGVFQRAVKANLKKAA